ncbi:cytochrome P450 86A1-like [Momordica charantia]|uniref:Cytochrome P450 86A1-like n=1 Tax=Momordica charantia TaxID=3673 RepID=A0A6J1D9S3_MOMCH|nr:cytochrome P450 86A1-like [Momordica charantia]
MATIDVLLIMKPMFRIGRLETSLQSFIAAEYRTAVDLQDLLLRLTFDNICGLTFGKDPETLSPELAGNPFAMAFDTATEATLQRLLYPGLLWRLEKLVGIGKERKLKKSLSVVENYMNDAIAARKESPSDDLLSRFMKKRDADGNHFSTAVLHRIALNFVLAGLGKDLAYLQMKSVASAVLLRYRLSPVPGHRVEQKMSLTLFMKNGLHVYLQPRKL